MNSDSKRTFRCYLNDDAVIYVKANSILDIPIVIGESVFSRLSSISDITKSDD